jgi:hypothetical protein
MVTIGLYQCHYERFENTVILQTFFSRVATDIAVSLKITGWKEQISDILFFNGKRSCLRSRH